MLLLASLLIIIFSPLEVKSQLLLNEFMINPAGSETSDEFIEIYNDFDYAIDISGLAFGDEKDMDKLIELEDGKIIPPKSLALILDPDDSGIYDDLIPDSIPCFSIEDSRFGSYGLSNSSEKTYFLIHDSLKSIDSLTVPANLKEDYSYERVKPTLSQWLESINLRGSPGLKNTVSPPAYDLSLSKVSSIYSSKILTLTVSVINRGEKSWQGGWMKLSLSPDPLFSTIFPLLESTLELSELILPSDSSIMVMEQSIEWTGMQYLSIYFDSDSDMKLDNNLLVDSIFIAPEAGTLILNEFCPVPGEFHGAEYAEFVLHNADLPLNIKNLSYADATSQRKLNFLQLLYNDDYLLLAENDNITTSFPNLDYHIVNNWPSQNNSSDKIAIYSPEGDIISEMNYTSEFPITKDLALELINPFLNSSNPTNWSPVAQGSPGKINPSKALDYHLNIMSILCESEPQTNAENSLNLICRNDGLYPLDNITISCFADINFDTYFDSDEEFGNFISNNSLNPGELLEINIAPDEKLQGALSVLVEQNYGKSILDTIIFSYSDNPLRLNELMPTPEKGMQEWIELVNHSNEIVNLAYWNISDPGKICQIPESFYLLNPGQLALISENSDILYDYPVPDSILFILSEIPTLNSYSDNIQLLSPLGKVVDSMEYGPETKVSTGISLEFLSPMGWFPSMDSLGATPGQVNSQHSLINHCSLLHETSEALSLKNATCDFILVNDGYFPLNQLELFLIYEEKEFHHLTLEKFMPKDSLHINSRFPYFMNSGWNSCTIIFNSNELFFQDSISVFKAFDSSPVSINEVLFIYSDDNGIEEGIELKCQSQNIDLKGWLLETTSSHLFIPEGIGPLYRVLSKNISDNLSHTLYPSIDKMPLLKNSGDIIKLYDPIGRLMDSVNLIQHPDLLPGISLEKNNENGLFYPPNGWGRSLNKNGHSFGSKNSRCGENDTETKLEIIPRHLSYQQNPEGLLFRLHSESNIQSTEIHIFDLRGRRLFHKKQQIFNTQEAVIHWNGHTSNDLLLSPGLYLCVAIIKDLENKKQSIKESFTIYE